MGCSREATQGMGGWGSLEVTEKVYRVARSGEVVPEMRVPVKRAGGSLEVDRFVREPGEPVAPVNEVELGWTRSVNRRQRYVPFMWVADLLEPEGVAQVCTDFPSLMGRRARESNLSAEPR